MIPVANQPARQGTDGSRVVTRLLDARWCALVPALAVAGYIAVGYVAVLLIGEPILATVVVAAVTVVVVGLARTLRPARFAYAPRSSPQVRHLPWIAAGCGALAFLAGQSLALWIYVSTGSAGFDQSVETRQEAGVAIAALLTLIVAPAGEEALFRGVVYPLLRRRVGIWGAAALSAAVFGLVHGNVVQFASVLPMAVLAALLYERIRRLWPCVLLHMGFNLTATFVPASAIAGLANPVSAAALCLAFSGGIATFFQKAFAPDNADTVADS